MLNNINLNFFNSTKKDLKNVKQKLLNEMANDAKKNIEELTPIQTSALKNNYKIKKVNEKTYKITNDLPYGYIVNNFTAKQKKKNFVETGIDKTYKNLDRLFNKVF